MEKLSLAESLKAELVRASVKGVCIGLCTTSNVGKELGYYANPRKLANGYQYWHLVLSCTEEAIEIISVLGGLVDYWFLDIELKNSNFQPYKITPHLAGKNVLYIEPNALTVDAIMIKLSKNIEDRIMLIGTGRLAFALCNRLELSGANFRWFGSNSGKGHSAKRLSKIYGKYVYSSDEEWAPDLIINTIPASIDLPEAVYDKTAKLFIEVSGVSLSYLRRLKCDSVRLDIGQKLCTQVLSLIETNDSELAGRRPFAGVHFCSGGVIGKRGDIVVDNYLEPRYVIGIADGRGGFLKRLNSPFQSEDWV